MDAQVYSQQLQAQRAELLQQIAAQRGGQKSRSEAAAEHFEHTQDAPSQVATARETELALGEHELSQLAAIDAALARIAHGSYGRCMDCDAAISAARLKATPQAARCLHCQEKAEHH